MSKMQMINVEKDFQSSVNIAYDLHDTKKIKNFIPTTESISLFEEIFSSTNNSSTKRAHILIGAYGKGKSHIVLEILSLLLEKDKKLFSKFLNKVKEINPGLYQDAEIYIESNKKLLPIIISGSSTSLSQSFLSSLYQTLKQNDFAELMPDTNYTAAVNTIKKWEREYPATYKEFTKKINLKVSDYIERLRNYDSEVYSDFLDLYPQLTSGSEFNPFTGFDIVELYEKVNDKLIASSKGYKGIYVIYDEFSKYLESSIGKASINDIKLLQDFAEKCCRSGNNQMHLLLISHKEISNYIDTLPKEKVDGWKGVSERFVHIIMHSDYSQVYEIMNAAIIKNEALWNAFLSDYNQSFQNIRLTNTFKRLFVNIGENELCNIVEGCYPLHPVTTYILPRFSEKVAQNERTMFTFLSADEKNTLASLIKNTDYKIGNGILFITPDLLYDYFENQMRSEPYTSPIKSFYNISKKILTSLEEGSLESKIIKTLSLLYSLNQFERLPPTSEVINDIYKDAGYDYKEINKAINELLTNDNFLYLRRSNNYLQLKENSGTNIDILISDMIEKRKNKITDVQILNKYNLDKYLYPVEYNTNNEITRYFEFIFITANELFNAASSSAFESNSQADGVVIGIIPDDILRETIEKALKEKTSEAQLSVFVLPSKFNSISEDLRKLDAIEYIKSENRNDPILYDELELIEQDLSEIVSNFIRAYTHPEFGKSIYYAQGERKKLYRKASFSHLLSQLCENMYTLTPIINNEPLNKKELTGAARKSRNILIDAILNSNDADLGINGGQELSFKRSTLCVTGILDETGKHKYFDIEGNKLSPNYGTMFAIINQFIEDAKISSIPFTNIIYALTNKYNHFGMRLGVIPIYIAVIFSKIANNIVIKDKTSELKLNSETICNAIENPAEYFLNVVPWSKDKENYIKKLEARFADYLNKSDKQVVGYNYLLNAIVDWVRELPKYSRELKTNTPKEYIAFMNVLKTPGIGAQEILFNQTKKIFNSENYSDEIFHSIDSLKSYYDKALYVLETGLITLTKNALKVGNKNDTLCSCGEKFRNILDKHVSEHKFANHAENLYKVFATCGNDEFKVTKSLALTLTGINTVDWSETTIPIYEKQLIEYIETLKNYKYSEPTKVSLEADTQKNGNGTYFINFVNEDGTTTSRNFEKVEYSSKANGLKSEISNILDEYGQSISDAEKRQVLLKLLEELSK